MKEWHEDDGFWEDMAPKMFAQGHWTNASRDIDSIVSLLKIQKGARVLDLCCGPGRHSL